MSAALSRLGILALFATALASDVAAVTERPLPAPRTARLPIRFEANAGQFAAGTRFVARRGGAALFLGDTRALLSLPGAGAIALRVDGARAATPIGEGAAGVSHYLRGSDPRAWRTDVPAYSRVRYPGVLDGVDLVYHGEDGALEYDFVVAPGANADAIAIAVEGADDLSLTDRGDLAIRTARGTVVQPPPLVYQASASGERSVVASRYRLLGSRKVGFVVASYDRTRPLVIDPVIAFSTYLGGSGFDAARALAVDASGNTYLAGTTQSADFPLEDALQSPFGGCDGPCSSEHAGDVFVAKLDPDGVNLRYATYVGGSADESARAIALTASGEAVVVGTTSSPDFPLSGARVLNPTHAAGREGFVFRLSSLGNAFGYSTFLAGSGDDEPRAVALDASGNAYVAGRTTSTDLTTPDAPSPPATEGAFVLKLDPTGSAAEYVAYLRGGASEVGNAIALDDSRNPFLAGMTTSSFGPAAPTCAASGGDPAAFLAHYDGVSRTFDVIRCFGGAGKDEARALAVAPNGKVFVAGSTVPGGFPTTPGAFQAAAPPSSTAGFVARFAASGDLERATYLGGNVLDRVDGLALDSSGAPWLAGTTSSTTFPTRAAIQSGLASGSDAFVTRLSADLATLGFSTYFGGASSDGATAIAVTPSAIHVGGTTTSSNLPTLSSWQSFNAGSSDAFAARLSIAQLVIAPSAISLPVGGTEQFIASGGTGNYTFSLATNGSGATISATGAYATGVVGDTTDVVQVTDDTGVSATATVHVGPVTTGLVLSPSRAVTPPRGQLDFAVSGGTPPYVFGYVSNASDGFLNQQGRYSAGSRGGVQDIVRVVDATNVVATSIVTVTQGVAISPARPAVPPRGAIVFSAAGGSGTGFRWSLSKNASSGTIDAVTGAYTAGAQSRVVDTVTAQDSLGNVASVNVSVGGGVAIAPAEPSAPPRGTIDFEAFGGAGGYSWSLETDASGARIDAATGAYVAGVAGSVRDVVRVRDAAGSGSTVEIVVGPALSVTPGSGQVPSGGTLTFTAAGGSGEGYAFSLDPNASGGTIGPDGVYVAGANGGVDRVRLVDSLGSEAVASVTVSAIGEAAPGSSSGPAGFDGINIAGGGPGGCAASAPNAASAGAGPWGLGALALVGFIGRRRRREIT